MPEGHTIHRAARDHNSLLAAQKLTVLSPQGRFTDGASRLTGRICINIEAFGKHLIYHFDNGEALHIDIENWRIVHIATSRGVRFEGRFPRARGRATPKMRESANVEVVLEEVK